MHTLWRIALAVIVPLIAVGILMHLRDDAHQRARLTAAVAQKPAAPIDPAPAAQGEPRYAHLFDDLPPPPRVFEITERAMTAVDANQGFMPSIALVTECYEALSSTQSLESRVYCLQVDAMAFSIERGAPQAFQEADQRSNDYFVPSRFEARQLQFAPPTEDIEDAAERREGVLDALGLARRQVMTEFLERSGSR